MSQFMRITHSSEMRELDHLAENEYGIESDLLMENAGRAAVWILLEKFPRAGRDAEIVVFAGKGNNAGDAFVVARRLICLDCKVRVFHLFGEDAYRGSALKNFQILKRMNARMSLMDNAQELEAFFNSDPGPVTVVDGLLGTGLKGNLEGMFYDVVQIVNRHAHRVISLDIPSGVSGDTGRVCGASIEADLTVSFGFPKLGHFLPPGAGKRGELVNVDISLPPKFRHEGDKFLLMRDPMREALDRVEKERSPYGHKNAFGHVLLIGGSPGKLGAITMAARACHRMGTGLVTVASWRDSFPALDSKLSDESMAVEIRLEPEHIEAQRRALGRYSAIVVGPGLGNRDEAQVLLRELLMSYSGPLLLDADALNTIARYQMHELLQKRDNVVLTPHMGEMARLLEVDKDAVVDDRLVSLRRAIELTHSTVVLKGATSLISSPDDLLYVNHFPNEGMATGGSGDVLAGMIGGLMAQNIDPFLASQLGVYLHSMAGELAKEDCGSRSMTALDVIDQIPAAFKEIHVAREKAFPEEGRARLY